ncbi:P-loop containing nucleoside triphosphate hydrolase protein, partial [Panaeolus papilionaceus]
SILGPTGAGKSSFIEALAGEGQSLGISKDQLAGFTQEVTAYQVKNAMVQWYDDTYTLYLIDAPGFSDSKISELEIITKVKQWMVDKGVWRVHGVLYLSPITDTRAPGSKRRTIKMIQLLFHNFSFQHVNIVTTMWDRLSNPQAKKRAETNFAQLQDDIWKVLLFCLLLLFLL